jgi:ASC-1-like (ASCH) protein
MNHKEILILIIVIAVVILGIIAYMVMKSMKKGRGRSEGGMHYFDEFIDDSDEENITGGRGRFKLKMRDPGYTSALKGDKTVEVRLNKPSMGRLKIGNKITIARSRPKEDTTEYSGPKRFIAQIKNIKNYSSLKALIAAEGAEKLVPGVKGEAAVIKHYREFIPEEDEKKIGLIAITWAKI